MPIRDLIVTGVILGLLPLCFFRPWIGALAWAWIGLMNPHRLTWGFAYSMPFALLVALLTTAGFLLTKERRPLPRAPEVYLLVALWAVFSLSTITAVNPEYAWPQLEKVSKIFLMVIVSIMLLQEPRKVRALLAVIGFSIGFYGFKGGLYALRTGAEYHVLGPERSFIEGNTEIGLALNMVVPILIYLRREETRRWLRNVLLATIWLSIVAILGTYSRGAFLGLASILLVLLLKSRKRLLTVVVLSCAIPAAMAILPEKWFARMATIETYESDRSAMSRIMAWELAYSMALERPLLGHGFRGFTLETWRRYVPDWPQDTDAHSIYFQVLGEHGFVGLALYLALIAATWVNLRGLMRRARGQPSLRWIYNCSDMLEVSLVAYLVSGTFLSLSYFDLYYYIVAVTVILRALIKDREISGPRVSPHGLARETSPGNVGRGVGVGPKGGALVRGTARGRGHLGAG